MNLAQISAVVMDMDGVLWRGDELLPGVLHWIELLRERSIPFVLATNNSMRTAADYVLKTAKMGIQDIQESQILTSGLTTINYLSRHYPAGTPMYVVGGDGLRTSLVNAGFVLSDEAAAVIVGLDTALTYDKLRRATLLLRNGAAFVATNTDRSLPTPEGLVPGAGSIVAALRAASDREPIIMGKPNPPMFEAALSLLGAPAERTLMIGDRLDTDITGAAALGFKTALVLTGVSTRADLEASAVQPDEVFANLETLRVQLNFASA